jgi:hypothetical protein
MKYPFYILMSLFISLGTKAQKMFKIVEVGRSNLFSPNDTSKKASGYFRIVSNSDTSGINADYPVMFSNSIDTLKAIGELLKYEGDRRICALPIYGYSPLTSKIYFGKDTNYSVQIEALFIINQLVYIDAFNYSPYPVLVDTRTNKSYCVEGTAIQMAFRAYYKWYQVLKKKGIAYFREKSIMPLDGSSIKWF